MKLNKKMFIHDSVKLKEETLHVGLWDNFIQYLLKWKGN